MGDWDGDGRDSVGVYQQADTTLALLDDEGAAIDAATVAVPSDRPEGTTPFDAFPTAGDWDGDGRDAVGILWRTAGAMELPTPELDDPDATRTVPADASGSTLPVAGDWNGTDLVTIEDLRQIYGPLPDEAKVIEGLPALNAAMTRAGIYTPARKAAFLATVRNESGFRYDAVETGNERRYRGRGLIQLTGDFNYRAAGSFLGLDLVNNPDLVLNGLVSSAATAWYWTVARNINLAADELDMAAVNIAVGFAPNTRRDMVRCADFIAALRYYSGGTIPEGVNCARTEASRRLAFSAVVPVTGRPTLPGLTPRVPSAPAATVPPDLSSIPPEWAPPGGGSPAPTGPAPTPAPTTPPGRWPGPDGSADDPGPDRPARGRAGSHDPARRHHAVVHGGRAGSHDPARRHHAVVHGGRGRHDPARRHHVDGGPGLDRVDDAVREPVLSGAGGGIRTHTGQDLNLFSLPVGVRRPRPASLRGAPCAVPGPYAATLCGRELDSPDRAEHLHRQPDARDLQPAPP